MIVDEINIDYVTLTRTEERQSDGSRNRIFSMESWILLIDSLISASVFSTEPPNEFILPIHIPILTRLPIAASIKAYVTGVSHMILPNAVESVCPIEWLL